MLTSTPTHAVAPDIAARAQAVKLLAQRADYTTCHIQVTGQPQRFAAIALAQKFYRYACVLTEPQPTLTRLQHLSQQGEPTVMTPIRQGYALWQYEPTARLAPPPQGQSPRNLPSTLAPADCWIIGWSQPDYPTCSLQVADLPHPVPGLAHGQKLYSLYRREQHAAPALELGAWLSQRGDELVIVVQQTGYALYLYEPGAIVIPEEHLKSL